MGLYRRQKLENGAEICVWEISEDENELGRICVPVLKGELDELQHIKSLARRKEKLAVRALLNEIFSEKLCLKHYDSGKPYLQNSTVKISISHCKRFAAIIIHPEQEVGIDIESLERDFSAVRKKALSDKELDDFSCRHCNVRLAICWCAKEAIYKRMSQSDVDFAKQIIVDKFMPENKGELKAAFIHKDGKEEKFNLNYEIFENHVMVWLTD